MPNPQVRPAMTMVSTIYPIPPIMIPQEIQEEHGLISGAVNLAGCNLLEPWSRMACSIEPELKVLIWICLTVCAQGPLVIYSRPRPG